MAKLGTHTRIASVIGWPVEHSLSPAIQNAAFEATGVDAAFVAFAVEPARLAAAMAGLRAMDHLGASITVPHKQAVMTCCDELAPAAQAIGAVNCVVNTDGTLVGHNTDAKGFVDALVEQSRFEARDAKVILLGAGGAARAVAYGLAQAGASVTAIARTPAKVDWIECRPWERSVLEKQLADAQLLVDCTSLGLSESNEKKTPCPVPVEKLPAGAVVSSLVYHREPVLLSQAKARGLMTVDGAGMLVHQGAQAFRLWTGKEAPLQAMHEAMAKACQT